MTTEIEVGEFLEHFGVKGMKWGKRKGESDGPSAIKAARKEVRGEVKDYFKSNKKVKVGAVVVAGILATPLAAGGVATAAVMRSQGHSRGKAAAIGFLTGPIGGIVVAERSARRRVQENG